MEENRQNSLYQPQTSPQKRSGWKIALIIVLFALIAAVAAALVLHLTRKDPADDDEPEEKEEYAAIIGTHSITAAEMNYFYIDYVHETYSYWYESYGEYTDTYIQLVYGLDVTVPLDEQYYDPDEKTTWADFFINQALQDAAAVYAVYDAATADGFSLSEEAREELNMQIGTVELYAQAFGYNTTKQYLRATYGKDADMNSYKDYLELCAIADAYYRSYENSLVYEDADLRAYEAERYHQFSSFSYSYYYISVNNHLSGGTPSADGSISYSDAEREAAITAAKSVADAIARSGASTRQELDNAIASQNSTGSSSMLKEHILYDEIPYTFQDWLCYSGRKAGDITLVADQFTDQDGTATTHGYYVVMFHERDENLAKLVNVRHILFSFEGGSADEFGNIQYSVAEKTAALNKANAVLDTYCAGTQTEDSFAALVADNSNDTGSVNSGGLYEDVYPGQMVKNFNDWCFDENRRPGDVAIVETEYGYHIMYYVGTSETSYRDYLISQQLRRQDHSAWYESIVSGVSADSIDLDSFYLDYVISP